jgi:hypothetical protein
MADDTKMQHCNSWIPNGCCERHPNRMGWFVCFRWQRSFMVCLKQSEYTLYQRYNRRKIKLLRLEGFRQWHKLSTLQFREWSNMFSADKLRLYISNRLVAFLFINYYMTCVWQPSDRFTMYLVLIFEWIFSDIPCKDETLSYSDIPCKDNTLSYSDLPYKDKTLSYNGETLGRLCLFCTLGLQLTEGAWLVF